LLAKVAVESLLFFVNFAVQRDWIFLHTSYSIQAESPQGKPSWFGSVVLWILLLAPVAVGVACFQSAHLLSQPTWSPLGLHHLARYTRLFAVLFLIFAILIRRWPVLIVAGIVIAGSVIAAGPAAVATVLLFVFSAAVWGRLVFGDSIESRFAFLAGVALLTVA